VTETEKPLEKFSPDGSNRQEKWTFPVSLSLKVTVAEIIS
jgi:hypothetical protein